MKKRRIFLSSVQKEFASERAALLDYLAAPRSCGGNFGENFGRNFGENVGIDVGENVGENRLAIAGAIRQRPLHLLGGETEGSGHLTIQPDNRPSRRPSTDPVPTQSLW